MIKGPKKRRKHKSKEKKRREKKGRDEISGRSTHTYNSFRTQSGASDAGAFYANFDRVTDLSPDDPPLPSHCLPNFARTVKYAGAWGGEGRRGGVGECVGVGEGENGMGKRRGRESVCQCLRSLG